jgi:flagellar basal body-associated protein FliL
MSEEGVEKSAEAAPKKSKTGLIIGISIAMVTLVGGSVAGAVLGPRLLGTAPAAAEGKSEGKSEGKGEGKSEGKGKAGAEKEKIVSMEIPALVVDLRDADGRIRHLKVGMAAELSEGVTAEDFKLFVPRGREAILNYLRSLTFEDVSDPTKYQSVRDELTKRMTDAVGAEHVQRMMLVDFVLQ